MPIRETGKNGKAGPSTKKSGKRSRKPAQQAAPTPEQIPAPEQTPAPEQIEQPQEPITVAAAVMENPPADTTPDAAVTLEAPAAAAPDAPVDVAPVELTEIAPVSLQTITNAYGDFTRKSIEQTSSFFEQLAGVRSLGKALELQGAFAQQTYETFVSESRRIRELHSELTMQRLRNLEGFVAKMKPTRST